MGSRWIGAAVRRAVFSGVMVGVGVAIAADNQAGLSNWFETVAEAERLAEKEARQAAGGGLPFVWRRF